MHTRLNCAIVHIQGTPPPTCTIQISVYVCIAENFHQGRITVRKFFANNAILKSVFSWGLCVQAPINQVLLSLTADL